MSHPIIYAKNRRGDAVYKLEPIGNSSRKFATLLFTTAAGEESYYIDKSEYQSFLKVFGTGSSKRIIATDYYLKRRVLRRLHKSPVRCNLK